MHRPDTLRLTVSRLAVVLLLLPGGCGGSGPELAPLSRDATLMAFGDSLTVGVGAKSAHTYPSVLQQLSGRRVINAGVSGETTAGGLPRLREILPVAQPDLLVLLEGGNDILRSVSPSATRRNLQAMVEFAQSQDVPVVLIGVPNKLLFSDSADYYADIAEQYGLVFDGDTLAGLLRDSGLKSDSIHLNADGYRLLAEAVHTLLVDHGAL
jgi:lysophospholipase L1-like esterase